MTTLYRHFAADGTLLYVGISSTALLRLHQHKEKSEWFKDIARITMVHFETREDALAAEKVAIQTELPRYNKHWWVKPKKERRARRVLRCDACCAAERPPLWCGACKVLYHKQYGAAYRARNKEKLRAYQKSVRDRYKPSETPAQRRERYLRSRAEDDKV